MSSPATALAIVGDRYHNSDYIRTGLGKTLVQDAGITVDFTDDIRELSADNLKRRKLLIMLRDGMTWPDGYPEEETNAGWVSAGSPPLVSEPPVPTREAKPSYWMTAAQGEAVRSFVESGGGALLLHNVTYISPHNADFRDVLGAVTEGHPEIRTFHVKVVDKSHPVTDGVADFVVTDEQHYMRYEKDPEYLLLESVNEDGLDHNGLGPRSAAGWAYDYGKGRVCYLAPGHLLTVLWNPEYEKLLRNAAGWLLRRG